MEYYSALQRKEILTCHNMNETEDIMLSEISQAQNDNYSSIPLICGSNLE